MGRWSEGGGMWVWRGLVVAVAKGGGQGVHQMAIEVLHHGVAVDEATQSLSITPQGAQALAR